MKEQLQAELKRAMKSRDTVRLTTIRSLLSAIQYAEMESETESVSEQEITSLMQREVKRRGEEIDFAKKAGRTEQLETLQQEIAIIEAFLPSQLSAAALEDFLKQCVTENPSATMGELMKMLKVNFAGQFDGKVASTLVKQILEG